jgi:hypothetical protein
MVPLLVVAGWAAAVNAFDTQPNPLIKFSTMPFSAFKDLNYLPLPQPSYGTTNHTWVVGVSCCNYSMFKEALVVNASKHYGLGLTPGLECTQEAEWVAEWGYEFQAFSWSNPAFRSSNCINKTLLSLKENTGIVSVLGCRRQGQGKGFTRWC